MYYNEEHNKRVIDRGDNYTYIGSYKTKEITIDGKKSKSHIRVRCPYCGEEYDVRLDEFINNKSKCTKCCNTYENSFAYYIQQELQEPLNKYWDWEKNNQLGINPYCIKSQSNKKVYIKCTETDYHGSYSIMVSNFYKGRRCPYCTARHGKVHPRDSFGQWLIDEFGDDGIEKYWSPKNTLDPFKISKHNKKIVYMLCQNKNYHNDEGGYPITCESFYKGHRCSYCSKHIIHKLDSIGQYLIDTYGNDAIDKYWSNKNIINPFKLNKTNTTIDIWIYCQEKDYHNDNSGYKTTANSMYLGNRCPYCNPFASHKVHPKDSFGSLYPEKAKYWSKNNNKSPYEVTPKNQTKYKFICEKCGEEFERTLGNMNRFDNGVVCLKCNSSQLETKTKNALEKYNVKYNIQVEYNGLIGLKGGNLSYDFYLPNHNLLIECQGEQHEKFIPTFHKTEKDFKKQLEHDRRKKQYAKEHNIDLLEIWYYDIDNIEEILLETLQIKNN